MGMAAALPDTPARAYYLPADLGPRALYLAEIRNRREALYITDTFDTLSQLVEVTPVAAGDVTAFAVLVPWESETDVTVLKKIDWLVKTQFAFSLMEHSPSRATWELLLSLAEEAGSRMAELPRCAACGTPEAYPARLTVEGDGPEQSCHLDYCARCAGEVASLAFAEQPAALLQRSHGRGKALGRAEIILLPLLRTPIAVPAAGRAAAAG